MCEAGYYWRQGSALARLQESAFRIHRFPGRSKDWESLARFLVSSKAAGYPLKVGLSTLHEITGGLSGARETGKGKKVFGRDLDWYDLVFSMDSIFELGFVLRHSNQGEFEIWELDRSEEPVGFDDTERKLIAKKNSYSLAIRDYWPHPIVRIDGIDFSVFVVVQRSYLDGHLSITPGVGVPKYRRQEYTRAFFDPFCEAKSKLSQFSNQAASLEFNENAKERKDLIDQVIVHRTKAANNKAIAALFDEFVLRVQKKGKKE